MAGQVGASSRSQRPHVLSGDHSICGRSGAGASTGHDGAMPHVLIIHEVADVEAWTEVFHQAAAIRKEAGERSYQVLVDHTAPNRIVHLSTWTSLDEARAFFESPRLVQIRADAGVHEPTFTYLHEVEAGTL